MNNDTCCGCRLCEKSCPKQAIKMKSKWFGFNYPDIDETKCIHCGLCNNVCPVNNIKRTNVINSFVGYSDNRMNSSSGGIFPKLAEYIISNKGIVFGAVFDKDFNVEITWTDNDFINMLGSKYVQSDVKNTYEECKLFLEQNKLVLYTGTPCQIYGLKSYLKKDYDNLITLDIFCHGTPSPKVWQCYLKSFNKEIESINFRDKRESWEQYHLTIKFKDGTEFTENHNKNRYMNLFLQNKILRKSCFECKFRSNSIADISVGDAWGIQSKLNDHKGLSDVIIHSEKGKSILDKLNLYKENISYNMFEKTNCINLKFNIPNDRVSLMKLVDSPKIGIITLNPNHYKNIGNTLQAFALQSKIKELVPNAKTVEILNQKEFVNCLEFYKNHCKYVANDGDESYDMLIAGSDQIWGTGISDPGNGIIFDRQFLLKSSYSKSKRIFYAPSFGHHNHVFSKAQKARIYNSLKDVKISTREIIGKTLLKTWFNLESQPVLDPTMLYDKEFYLNSINEKEVKSKNGIFVYVLDKNAEWNTKAKEISNNLNQPILPYDGSVENFIKNMNTAALVITDSYHGSVFSLIFNNPFICLRNKMRGNDRFDDLCSRFNISERFIENLADINIALFNMKPNCNEKLLEYRKESLDFLIKSLYSL